MSLQFQWILIFVVGFVSGQDVKKAVGENVKFHPGNIPPPINSILWKHTGNDGRVFKAIEWDTVDGLDVPNPRYKGIATLNEKTGEITLTSLKLEHTGVYSIEINSKEQVTKFRLTVMAPVCKPKIRIETSNNDDVKYLYCDGDATIIWKNSAGETLSSTSNTGPPKGEFITVNNTHNRDNYYTCTLQNDVSEKTSDPVHEKDLFPDPGPSIRLIILGIMNLIIFGTAAASLLYIRHKKTVNKQLDDVTVYASPSEVKNQD